MWGEKQLPSIYFCLNINSFYFSPLQNAEYLHVGEKQELLGLVLKGSNREIAEMPDIPKVCSFPVSELTAHYHRGCLTEMSSKRNRNMLIHLPCSPVTDCGSEVH